ncbi:MAG: transglutaminase-like domain-containing protein [Gammaproteobacteria bacterium]|nr:transglutaminase-like domain-containing protein [Gammaproteobacteria bacterium]
MRREYNYSKLIIVIAIFSVIAAWILINHWSKDFDLVNSGDYLAIENISYSVTIQNQTSRSLKSANVSLYMPVSISEYHEALEIKTKNSHKIFKDKLGNQILYLDLSDLQAKSSRIAIVSILIGVMENTKKNDEYNLQQYLIDDPVLRINSKEVSGIVNNLRKSNKSKTAEDILSWIKSYKNIEVQKNQEEIYAELQDANMEMSVPMILKNNITDPVSNAYIFLAVSRASGIPARMLVGIDKSAHKKYSYDDIIIWVEYFEQGVWHGVNIEKSKLFEHQSNYIAFRIFNELPQQQADYAYKYLYESSGVDVIPGSLSIQLN